MGVRTIKDSDEIVFNDRDQLSYLDDGSASVMLYIDEVYQGNIKVWEDEGGRFIYLNYEPIYLTALTQEFFELN